MANVWDHDRNPWIPESKPEGIYRILCLGDSMTHGSGVLPYQTLPAQLETLLNQTLWDRDIEVINLGVSGYSFSDAYNRYLRIGQRFKPDNVVFIVCDNDAELFSINYLKAQGKTVSYGEHIAETWNPNGIHFPYFQRAIMAMAQNLVRADIPVTVAFYWMYDDNAPPFKRSEVVGRLKALCESVGINFVDLSAEFTGTESATHRPELKVNAADGHPSARAHEIAAYRLARYFIKRLPIASDMVPHERQIIQNLWNNAEERLASGYRSDYVLSVLHHALA
ncbi:MAG: SGNH/GDSL hydrolase family protein, partial [Fibrobacterota bacterium]